MFIAREFYIAINYILQDAEPGIVSRLSEFFLANFVLRFGNFLFYLIFLLVELLSCGREVFIYLFFFVVTVFFFIV